MNSRVHGSERALADLACERIGGNAKPRLLVGGLGMGFTLAAALQADRPRRRGRRGGARAGGRDLESYPDRRAGRPSAGRSAQPRVRRRRGRRDSARGGRLRRYLDGRRQRAGSSRPPRRTTGYTVPRDLGATRAALRPHGVLAVWSASPDRSFGKWLEQAGFDVREHVVRPHRAGKGPRHHIWIAVT